MKKRLNLLLCALLVLSMLTGVVASAEGTFKIGVILPLTGAFAEFGAGQKAAYDMAIEYVNANGGVGGKELVVEFQDSGSDAVSSAELMRKYIEDPEVMMVLGDYDSGTCLADCPIAQENKMPMLTPSASNLKIPLTGEYIFSMVGIQQDECAEIVGYMMQKMHGTKTMAMAYLDNSWGQTIFENITRGCGIYGVEMKLAEPVSPGETDFAAIISKMRQTGADTVFLALQVTEMAACVNQMAQTGYSSDVNVILNGVGYTSQFLDLTGANSEGMVTYGPFYIDKENAEQLAWYEDFTGRCGLEPNAMTACPYDAVIMCCEAIAREGADTRDAVRDAIATVKDYEGITGTISFDNIGTVHRFQWIVKVVNGAFELQHGLDYYEGYVPYTTDYEK